MKKIILIVLVVLLGTACGQKKKVEEENSEHSDFMLHKVVVNEVIQTSNYTYLAVNEGSKKYWTAVSKGEYSTGDQLFYFDAAGNVMENFHSKELNRDFDTILFLNQVSRKGDNNVTPQSNPSMEGKAHAGRKEAPVSENISVAKVAGGLSIAELYGHKTNYANKKVIIRGVVVKVNKQIMGRNWIHIQDGTKFGNDYDLTVTTQDVVEVGAEVTIEGVVALDKDFTSGYFYPVIVEGATLVR